MVLFYDNVDKQISPDLEYSGRSIVKSRGVGSIAFNVIANIFATNNRNDSGARSTVRTTKGVLYSVSAEPTDDDVEMWRAVDGSRTFVHVDSANDPTCDTNAVACAIDSADIIHVVYWDEGTGLRYNTFDTSDDTWGTPETANSSLGTTATHPYVSITIDSNDIPHVVWNRDVSGTAIDAQYKNRIGGNWVGGAQVGEIDPIHPIQHDICINEDDIPQVIVNFHVGGGGVIHAKIGNLPDTTGFTTFSVDGTADSVAPSMIIDKKGNTYVSWVEADGDLQVTKHLKRNAWSSWLADIEIEGSIRQPKNITPITAIQQQSNKKMTVIQVAPHDSPYPQNLTIGDINYLKSYGLSSKECIKFGVFGIRDIWLNNGRVYTWQEEDEPRGRPVEGRH